VSFRFEDKDKGYRKALTAIFGKKPLLKVGIFGEKGDEPHEDSDLTVLAVATFHEFGLGVPQRSFIRAWCDSHESEVLARLREDSERAIVGELTWEQVLNRLGLFIVGGIQEFISAGIDPPLAESTLRRKTVNGRIGNVPLINKGQLRSSITYALSKLGEK
jgi:hypothetical protein